jgi:hypothetical protein
MNGAVTGYTARLLRLGMSQADANTLVQRFMQTGNIDGLKEEIRTLEEEKENV